MDALILIGLLAALAITSLRWGVDSSDGVDSDEYRRNGWWRGESDQLTLVQGAWTPGMIPGADHDPRTVDPRPYCATAG